MNPTDPSKFKKGPKASDIKIILDHLLANESFTVREAYDQWSVMGTSQIVRELRKRGIPVVTTLIHPAPNSNHRSPYARYSLKPDDIAAIKEAKKWVH